MVHKEFLVTAAVMLLLTGCGGGGGDVNSTPGPAPTPVASTLENLSISTDFVAVGSTSQSVLAMGATPEAEPTIVSSRGSAAGIRVSFDAATNSYTVQNGSRESKFLPEHKQDDESWRRNTEGGFEVLALDRAPTVLDLKYVSAGYWQRNTPESDKLNLEFDAFTFGFPTPSQAVPRVGTANYDVLLFAFIMPKTSVALVAQGSGRFEVDFLNGIFRTNGGAQISNLTVDYSTGTHNWFGGGKLSANNAFNGTLTFGSRYQTINATLEGQFYGPDAIELGAAFRSENDTAGLIGTIIGTKSGAVSEVPFTALPNSTNRTYYTQQETLARTYYSSTNSYEPAATIIPSDFGRIEFSADGAVKLILDPSSSVNTAQTFTMSDRVGLESNEQFTVYAKGSSADGDKLVLSNPGPANSQIALTYSGFGYWEATRTDSARTSLLQDWFVYGVLPTSETFARTGTGNYAGVIAGQGVSFGSNERYSVSGTAEMSLNFSTRALSGTLTPVATPMAGAAPFDLPSMTFSTTANTSWSFSTDFAPPNGGAEFSGRLYGPSGDELAGVFRYTSRNQQGFPAAQFSGIVAAKLTN